MELFFSVGEPSGDIHGANLIRELKKQRSDLRFVGFGGPRMAEAGCLLHTDLTRLAMMFVLRALLNLHKFWSLIGQADRYFRHHRPDAVILIDYPGFNWWIARRAKAHRIPVYYYGTPQIWGWASWRVKKLRRLVDHALCKLPFEPAWYGQRGCNATFIGHPFFDEVRRQPLDEEFLARLADPRRSLVAILPGSRTQEVNDNLPSFLQAAKLVHAQVPGVRFALAAYRSQHAEMARQMIADAKLPADFPLEIHVQRTPEIIQGSLCTMAVSGSVSLELLHYTKPTVILYKISKAANLVQGYVRQVEYITLVNLLMGDELPPKSPENYDPDRPGAARVLFPEYLTSDDRSADIARHVVGWLTNAEERTRLVTELAALRDRVGAGGASRRGAEYILETLDQRPTPIPRPHFLGRPNRRESTRGEAIRRNVSRRRAVGGGQ